MPTTQVPPDTPIAISDERWPYWKVRMRDSSYTRLKLLAVAADMTLVAAIDRLARWHVDQLRDDMTSNQRGRFDAGKMTARELQSFFLARANARLRKRRGGDDRVAPDADTPTPAREMEPAA
jgi:hypothetical protein